MQHIKYQWVILLLLISSWHTNVLSQSATDNHNGITQVSTIQALLQGIYDADTTFGQLKQWGDFGVGTFEGLDGEMVAVDGQFYQITADGRGHIVPDAMKTPFATVNFFKADLEFELEQKLGNYPELQTVLDKHLPTLNRLYAVKITGTFDYVKTRSFPKQAKPYPPVATITAKQNLFEFKPISGVLVGYRFPDYLGKLNTPGYHFHFLTADKQAGGHVLECHLSKATVTVDFLDSFTVLLPQHAAFQNADLKDYSRQELEKSVTGKTNSSESKAKY